MITILLTFALIVSGIYLYLISCENKEINQSISKYKIENDAFRANNGLLERDLKAAREAKDYVDSLIIDLKEQNVVLQKKYTEAISTPKTKSKKKKN